MPLSRSRDYLSIGEVLDAVRDDFPDISISKIRFLESEGLIEPERTASGYRKFYSKDVERLRYILTLQRDHFMPLKVIRDRLAVGDPAPAAGNGAPAPVIVGQEPPPPIVEAPQDTTDVSMDRSELMKASGLTEQELAGLEEFGIVSGEAPYDGTDLMVARAAKGFLTLGIEPRHLRMYRQFTEREIGFFEQLLSPSMRRSDPEATRQTGESLRKLETLSRSMREGMLRAGVRELL